MPAIKVQTTCAQPSPSPRATRTGDRKPALQFVAALDEYLKSLGR